MTPETLVTNQIIAYLRLKGYVVKKIYNGGVATRFDQRTKKIVYRKKSEEFKGIPDLIAYNTSESKFFFIEVKSAKGKIKPEQREFIESFNSCEKRSAFVARSVEDLIQKGI